MASRYTLTNEQRHQQVQDLTKQLEEGVRDVFESERYSNYLKVMSKFTHYSVRNTILIAMQTGGQATMVAGYEAWQKNFGRHVNKGEKAIKIFAPMSFQRKKEIDVIDQFTGQPVCNPDGTTKKEEVEVTIPSFRVTNVFDISQTSGPPLPTIVEDLEGNVDRYNYFVEAVKKVSPVPIAFEKMEGKDGYYHQVEKRIAINDSLSEKQSMAAIIHELAHAKLHALDPDHMKESAKARGKDQRTMEVEAESVAAVVNAYFGIDTSANSWGYVAAWSKNKELPELTASLQIIKDTAGEIIDGILEELERMKEVLLEQANDLDSLYPKEMTADEIAHAMVNIFDEYPSYDFRNMYTSEEHMITSIKFDLMSGKGMKNFAGSLKDVMEDSLELTGKAGVLLNRISEYVPNGMEDLQPLVKINVSQHPDIKEGSVMSISAADETFREADENQVRSNNENSLTARTYILTYTILYTDEASVKTLNGQFIAGFGEGGLISSLRAETESSLNSPSRIAYRQGDGPEKFQQYIAEQRDKLEHVIPLLQQYCHHEDTVKEQAVTQSIPVKEERKAVPAVDTKERKEKKSIHERLKENKEKIAKKPGKDKPQKGVELS